MSKRIVHLIVFLFTIGLSHGQEFSGWSTNHLGINTYNGGVATNALILRLSYSGTYLNEPNWKLSMKLSGPILSDDGKVFPAEKISLIPDRTEGQAKDPGPLPTVSQIGMPSPVPVNGTSEVFLVPSSNAPLYNVSQYGSYYDLKIFFNLAVAGGSYLGDLQNDRRFIVPFQFTAYRSNNSVIGVYNIDFTIQVHRLSGTPPSDENQYAIRVSTEASNGLLEFKTPADYINGKKVTYSNGLSVTANTAYQVTVRSIPSAFTSATGKTLPLDVVRLQLSGGAGTLSPVTLSTDEKTILQGSTTDGVPRWFDIIYSTEGNDGRLFNVSADHYTTSLMYEISPR